MKKLILLVMVALCFSATTFAQDTTMHKSDSKMSHAMYTCSMHPEIMKTKSGKCPECGMALIKAKATYSCPMHADQIRSDAGKCPKCGMDMKRSHMKGMKM